MPWQVTNHRICYPLKRMLWAPPLTIAIFGPAAYLCFMDAAFDHERLVLFRAFQLSETASILAYWALFAFAATMTLMGVFLLFGTLEGKRTVTVTPSSIVVPKFSIRGLEHQDIPFSTIRNLELYRAGNGLFLNIHHMRGRSALAGAAFHSEADFKAIHDLLKANAGANGIRAA